MPPVARGLPECFDLMAPNQDLILSEVGGRTQLGEVSPDSGTIVRIWRLNVNVFYDVNATSPQHRREQQLEASDLITRPMVRVVHHEMRKAFSDTRFRQQPNHRGVGGIGLQYTHIASRESTDALQRRPPRLVGGKIFVDT